MPNHENEKFCPKSQKEWRKWLATNHEQKQAVWLVYYKASSNVPSLTWSEAVDEAICFGWIDSTKKTIDEQRYMQYFSKRKPTSTWSKINKDKVDQLLKQNKIKAAGLKSIEVAKHNGNWSLMDDVENLVIPTDLNSALMQHKGALDFFKSQSKSIKKGMLHHVVVAKRQETRQKRIDEIVSAASLGKIPDRFV